MKRMSPRQTLLVWLLASTSMCQGFVLSSSSSSSCRQRSSSLRMAARKKMEPEEIKSQLEAYLEKRRQMNADEVAKQEKGRVIGGTKGNKVLEYVSGAPVKARIVDRIPNIFDYDELTRYGYSSLVTPIMELGGRRGIYELMGMEPPVLPGPPPKLMAAKLNIDRTGQTDKARYTGLKMGQILDDNAMGEALQRATEKMKKGERMRPTLEEEEFERPFADKRNTGPRQTPEWTVESLDEYTKTQGRAISWARRAKEGAFVKDPAEVLDLSFGLRMYCIFVAIELAFAFGRSSHPFLEQFLGIPDAGSLPATLQAPGLALAVAGIASGAVCGFVLAPERNRSSFVWAIKGLLGGPLVLRELLGLEALITQGEKDQQNKAAAAASKQ